MARQPGSLAFCVQCHNRLHHLRRTLPRNIEAAYQHGDVSIAVLDYGSRDGLYEWAARVLRQPIADGKVTYGRALGVRVYHASRAKNLAHRLSAAEFLVNLDADNYLEAAVGLWRTLISAHPTDVVRVWSGRLMDGTFGRIGLPRTLFARIGGYDERLLPMGYQDIDLIHRAVAAGAAFTDVIGTARAIPNTKAESMRHIGALKSQMTYAEMNERNRRRSVKNLKNGLVVANRPRRRRIPVEVNFHEVVRI